MSVLSRARRFFSETWKRQSLATTDETAPLTFVPDLVSGEYTDVTQANHLLKVAWEDPIAYRICILLSRNVFDDWFVIKKKATDEDAIEELEEHEQNKQIQEEFTRMNAKYHFTQALIGERIFGRSFVVYNYNIHRDEVELGYQVATLDVFTDENTTIPQEAFSLETGEPEYIVVSPNAAYLDRKENIPWPELTMWCTRPIGRSYEGYSALSSVWNELVQLRESIDAAVWTHKKYGVGIFLWTIKGGLSTEKFDAIQNVLQNLSSRRAAAVEQDDVEKVEWLGPSQSGTTSIIEGCEFLLGRISAGCGIPKDIFTGVSAGAITGSEINNKALYAAINGIQSDVEPFVLDAIQRMGYAVDDMVIAWNTRYAADELEQAQTRQMNADALIKEKQAERGTDFQIGYGPMGGPKDATQNRNQAGVQAK